MSSQPCPVCENGVVPAAFYGEDGNAMVTCRTCGGTQSIPRPQEGGAAPSDGVPVNGL